MSGTNTTAAEPYPMDDLLMYGAELKDGYGIAFAVVTSVSAILSLVCSSLMIAMISRSEDRLSTAYHRLLMGMAVGDVLFSFPHALFQAHLPSDISYMTWNANGNMATCTLGGFVIRIGATLSLCYTCSLILYYLAVVKVDDESSIRLRMEPFLHGVPIATALAQGVIGLVNENYNADGTGLCTLAPVYDPPHCVGYGDGEVRAGFEIPCGRGENESLYQWFSFVVFMVPPAVTIVSFGMIYIAVRRRERRVGGNSASRAVLHRALAYTVAYFMSWIWAILGELMMLANVEDVENPFPYDRPDAAQLVGIFLWSIFVPLQGVFNFLVYIHPKVKLAKQSEVGNLSWLRAFAKALSTGLGGHEKKDDQNTPGTNSGPPSEMEVVLDADVKLATDVSAPFEQDDSTSTFLPPVDNEKAKEEIECVGVENDERESVQASIPLATFVPPVDNEEAKEEIECDGVENNMRESGGQSDDDEDASEANADRTACPQDIDPQLRSILEERGVVVATLEHIDEESNEISDDDFEDNEAEKLHQMKQRLSTIDIIPGPRASQNDD